MNISEILHSIFRAERLPFFTLNKKLNKIIKGIK